MAMKNRHRFIIVIGICLLGLALASPAHAVYFNYADFSDVSDFLLIKQAQGIYDNVNYSPGRHVLRLTRTTGDTLGVAWLQDRITLAPDYSFSTTFLFRMFSGSGGDGFTFVVQTLKVDETMWGGGGGNLGYGYDESEGQTRIAPSVAVEFDTWSNYWFPTNRPPYDPNIGGDNHMDINWNGAFQDIPEILGFPAIDLNDGGPILQAWIEYDGINLRAWVGSPGVRPVTPVLNYAMSLGEILETNQVYLGFTASYSGAWQHHDILSWQFSSVPAPSTILLLGTGLLSLLGLGKRQRK